VNSTTQQPIRAPASAPSRPPAAALERSAALRRTIKNLYIYVVLLLIVAIFSVLKLGQQGLFDRGSFLSPDSIINLLRMSVPILTLSGAFTLLMICGQIDLSVGSGMSLIAVVFALMIREGFGFLPAIFLAALLGSAMGALNGFTVMKLRITPVIATLVTLNLFKGAALLIVPGGISSIRSTATRAMPAWINDYARQDVLLGKTILGKYAAAIGGNRTAAELSGISAVKYGWILYILVGVFVAMAGVARASYMSLGDPLSGEGMELDCIIAVLLGGTAFSGGEGSVLKTVVGALIIMSVTTGLMTVIPAYWQNIAKGSVLLFAVVLNHLLVRSTARA
jgi:ribose/xylose/arabinose/galactoside ABC-type transport system permease subunit